MFVVFPMILVACADMCVAELHDVLGVECEQSFVVADAVRLLGNFYGYLMKNVIYCVFQASSRFLFQNQHVQLALRNYLN